MARSVVKTLIGFSAALIAAGVLTAQDPFQEGVTAYRLGDTKKALAKFEQVLAENPSNAAAFKLWRETDAAVWRALLLESAEDGQIQKIAEHLLDLAKVGRKEMSRDESEISKLVQQATSGDYEQRSKAVVKLASDHGEFAVPDLVQKLGDGDDPDGQVYAINALVELGRSATLPLVEALGSDSGSVRRNAIAALDYIKDERALASLVRCAERDNSEAVRQTAAAAVKAMGASGANAIDLYLANAQRYLTSTGVRSGDRSDVVWSLKNGKLMATDVPATIYNFELAKKAAHRALLLNASSHPAKTLVARAYIGEAAAIQASVAAGAEAALAAQVPALTNVAAALGVDVVRSAVNDSVSQGMVAMAITGIDLLGEIENRNDLASSPLVAQLRNPDARIADAAAIALTKAGAGAAIPDSGAVVAALSGAVQLETVRNIKVIDDTPVGKKAVAEAGFSRGINPRIADSAASAMNDLYAFPNVDVVVINEVLPDALPEAIIGLIRKDARMKNVKILIVANDVDTAKERFGDRIDGTIKGPLSGDRLRSSVEEALEGVAVDEHRARAGKIAVEASHALATLAKNSIDVSGALDALVAQLDREDGVSIPAANAIGFGGTADQVAALVGVIQKDAASLDLKVACAAALGSIFGRSGELAGDTFAALMKVIGSGADMRLRSAVVRALGKASLPADAQLQLVEALRVAPVAGSMDG